MSDDQTEDLIRTDYSNLEDPEWWRSLDGDGVVLYAWGLGKYERIAAAIKQAGIILVTHMDTAGVLGPLNGLVEFCGSRWRVSIGKYGCGPTAVAHFVASVVYGYTFCILRDDIGRARHLKQADIIGAITPIAAQRIKKVCHYYGGHKLAARVMLIPHANASYMRYDPNIQKEKLIIAAGRWDDTKTKGTDLLLRTIKSCALSNVHSSFEIYGTITHAMLCWHKSLTSDLARRVLLKGVVSNSQLASTLQRAQISLCTSLSESYHMVSAEALCCGCSIVGPDCPEVPSMKWFAKDPHGRISGRATDPLSNAVLLELDAWDAGLRNPAVISQTWTSRLHAPVIAATIKNHILS